jgi:bacteriocin biosynthesis cyclodehydratase domain-containing protein
VTQNRFRLKRTYTVVAHTPDVVELRRGVWNPTSFHVTDESNSGTLARLISSLADFRSAGQLAELTGVSRSECEGLLDHLIQLEVVEDSPTTVLDDYLDHIVPTLKSARPERPARPIMLLGDPLLRAEIERNLRAAGDRLDISSDPPEPLALLLSGKADGQPLDGLAHQDLAVALECLTEYFVVYAMLWINPLALRALNRIMLELRVPWMHAAVDGPFLLVGPTYVPPKSACYECLESRITMNLRDQMGYQRYKQALATGDVTRASFQVEPVLCAILAAHTALEILNFSATGTSFTERKLLSIYLPTMEFAFHEILRVPGCSSCLPLHERDGTELYFDVSALANA